MESNPATIARSTPGQAGWEARLAIGLQSVDGRTRVTRREHRGPLVIQKPFYPRGFPGCELIVVHPPGGIVGGDHLRLEVDVGPQARALITTPGATKFYRSTSAFGVQETRLRVAEGATLEWTPQESILFDWSHSQIQTEVMLEGSARFLGWEMTALGRPAARAFFEHGLCCQRFELSRDGKPIFIERSEYAGGSESIHGRFGWGGLTALGVMVGTHCDSSHLEHVRTLLSQASNGHDHVAATLRDDLLIVRSLARGTRTILELFSGLREAFLAEAVKPPRIWAT